MTEQAVLIRLRDGDRVPLREEMIVGRQDDCGLQLNETHASRRHARIMLLEGEAWVEDLGSANGTYINDSAITVLTRLSCGDRLRFDMEEFEVFVPSDTRETSAPTHPGIRDLRSIRTGSPVRQ